MIESLAKQLTETIPRLYTDWASLPHPYVYASSRRKCSRRMAYEMLVPSLQSPVPPEVRARMERGKDRERDLNIMLSRLGQVSDPPFTVEGGQERIEIKARDGSPVIHGKIEGRLVYQSGRRIPYEIKTWATHIVERIDRFEDVLDGTWTWSGAWQLLAYMYSQGEPEGLLILDRAGIPKFIPVRLEPHLEALEDFLKEAEGCCKVYQRCELELGSPPNNAEQAMAYADSCLPMLPDFTKEVLECRRCWCYGTVCQPPVKFDGASVIDDPELESTIAEALEANPAHRAYERCWKKVKEAFRGMEYAMCGRFIVHGTWTPVTKTEVPEEIAVKFRRKDPKGRFDIEIIDTESTTEKEPND